MVKCGFWCRRNKLFLSKEVHQIIPYRILSCQLIRVLVVITASCYGSRMSTLAEIEAALPMLSSSEDLARVEVTVQRLQRERETPVHPEADDTRFDGRPWPKTVEEIDALLAELDALPPLLTAQ